MLEWNCYIVDLVRCDLRLSPQAEMRVKDMGGFWDEPAGLRPV
jgi:hypothetical protein